MARKLLMHGGAHQPGLMIRPAGIGDDLYFDRDPHRSLEIYHHPAWNDTIFLMASIVLLLQISNSQQGATSYW